MRIWIDLANSPHPLLFAPVSRALEERGHRVQITVRDHAQTLALARERWQGFDAVGGASPSNRAMKARAVAGRVQALRAWARARRPDLALSHNSYAQIAAARSMGIPAVTAMDFEHQPASHVAFRLADRVLLPEAYPPGTARIQGAAPEKTWRYPGVKEALYVGDFDPDDGVLLRLGVELPSKTALVVARTPPTRALAPLPARAGSIARSDPGEGLHDPRGGRGRKIADAPGGPRPRSRGHDDPGGGVDGSARGQRLPGTRAGRRPLARRTRIVAAVDPRG